MEYNPLGITSTLETENENLPNKKPSTPTVEKKSGRILPGWFSEETSSTEKSKKKPEKSHQSKLSPATANTSSNKHSSKTSNNSPAKNSNQKNSKITESTSSNTPNSNDIYIMSDDDLLEIARQFKSK